MNLRWLMRLMSADTNQQGAVFVELGEQNAAVVEQVS